MSEKCLPFSLPFLGTSELSKHRCTLMHHGSRLQFLKIQCLSQFRVFFFISPSKTSVNLVCWFHYLKDIIYIYIIYILYIISIKHYPNPQKKKLPKRDSQIENLAILLMVQKSSDHQLRLIVFPHYLQGFIQNPRGFLAGFLNHQQYLRIIDQSELPTSSTHNSDGLKNRVVEPPFAACEEIQHSNGTIFEQVHGGHLKKVGQKGIC